MQGIIIIVLRVRLGSTLPATHMHVADTVVYNVHDRQLRKIVCPGFLHIRQHGRGYYYIYILRESQWQRNDIHKILL